MNINHVRARFGCALFAAMVAAATLSAQAPAAKQPRPLDPTQPTTLPPPAPPEPEEPRFPYRYRPIVRIAQDYVLPADERVREVRVFFGDVTIIGRVDRDVVVTMGSARLAPTAVIEGTLAVIGGSAKIERGASIGRDLVIIGGTVEAPTGFSPFGQHVVIGSVWLGDTLRDVTPWITRGLLWGRLIVPDLPWVWWVVAIFFLLYLALNAVFERPVGASAEVLRERPLSMFMAGLLVLLLTVPVLAIVAASIIGLALVPFILCALIVAGLIGKAGVARAIGRSVLRSELPEGRSRSATSVIIGLSLLTLAYMVPILGFVTWAMTTVLGFGAAMFTFRGMLRRERPPRAAAPVAVAAPAAAVPMAPAIPAAASVAASAIDEPYDMPAPAAIPVAPPSPRVAFSEGLAQYPRATFLDRLAAFVLDCVLVAIASALLEFRNESYFFLLLFGYHVAFWAWRGTTLGGIICSLRVIRTHGVELRFQDAMVRGLASIFSLAALGIGCLWMLQDAERQMWHDKIAGTLVVRVPRELVLP
jgi:uncharacterized RDD family membrane protein YckC